MPKTPLHPLLNRQAQQARQAFTERYADEPTHLAAAPGRVNLIGEHTDYNAGLVMPMAIERWTVIAGRRRNDSTVRVYTTAQAEQQQAAFDLNEPITPGEPTWANYVRGVVAGWRTRFGLSQGFDAVIDSSVPIGGGLSSSAALSVACLTLLEAMTGQPTGTIDKARAAQQAENDFAGVPCGLMDPLASAGATTNHAMQIDFADTSIQQIALPDEVAVIITNCNKPHALVGGEYAERRSQCESAATKLGLAFVSEASIEQLHDHADKLLPIEYQRARHVVEENTRVKRFAEALRAKDWPTVGKCMYDSHASMRDRFNITTDELDTLVDLATSIGLDGGVIGSRMTGGGFGGCTVTLAFATQAQAVCEKIAADYHEATGIKTQPFITRAADGAGVINQ